MYSGQFEIRNVPVAGPACVDVVPVADLLPELHAARKEPPMASAAAAAVPPPMKRLREVRLVAKRERSRGSNSLEGMATVPFVDFRRRNGLRPAVTSRRASPRDPRWSGCPRRAAPATRRGPSRRGPRRRAATLAGLAP